MKALSPGRVPLMRCGRSGSAFGLADLPVVAEGIDDAAEIPAIGILHLDDYGCSGFDGAPEGGVGVVDGEDHADGSTFEGLGAEVLEVGSFVRDPEAGAVDGEVADDGAALVVVAEDLFCA